MSELTPEQTAHANFIKNQIDNKHLIPSLKTQIYAMGEYLDRYGDEKLVMANYDNSKKSTFTVTSNNPLTYGWEEVKAADIPQGTTPTEVGTLPEANSTNAGSYVFIGSDANKKYYKCMTYGAADVNNLKSSDSVKVVITLNPTMIQTVNAKPNIVIDGREYTSGIAGTDIIFYMNRDHRISILWSADIVETYLVIANR
jgi:hypothetical protein